MRIEITRVTSWERVVDAARFTVGKAPLGHEPSSKFKKKIIFAEHSPIRNLIFDIKVYDIPNFVSVHYVRHHEGLEKFVCSARPDRNGFKVSRHEQRKDDPTDMWFAINAQALINISRVRLCNRAEAETQKVWRVIIGEVAKIEPEIAAACIPNCIYRAVCPEDRGCGFDRTAIFKTTRKKYEVYFKG